MNARFVICAGGVLLSATASMIFLGDQPLAGQTARPQTYGQPQNYQPQPQPQPQYGQPQESETTRQLRLLYAKDGKEMPEMDIRKMPMVRHSPGTQTLRPADPNPSPLRRLGRLFSLGRESSSPPQYQPQPPQQQPLYHQPPQYNQPAARHYPAQPQVQQPAAAPAFPSQPQQSPVAQPRTGVPATNVSTTRTLPVQKRAAADDIPVLIDERQESQPRQKTAAGTPSASTSGGAANPFPTSSDSSKTPAKAWQKTEDVDPFTGKTLTDDAETTKQPASPPVDSRPPITKDAPPLQIKSFQQIQRDQLKQTHPLAEPKVLGSSGREARAMPTRRSVSLSPREEKLRRIAERRGLAGFRGFCPVVLRDKRELSDALLQFQSVYRNKPYYFSTATAKATFEQAPEKYAPVSSGIDIVRFADELKQTEGSLEHAVWFHGRLYFFASAETLRKFTSDPKKYAVSE